jgi:hypothetical protein
MTSEDLPALASESFRLAQAFCGACRDYHATWSYVRAAGLRKGAMTDLAFLKMGFETLADPVRVLIAGAADTGQLAAVAEALRGRRFSATLVDLCETPLALCRAFASRHGIPFAAHRRDIAEAAELGPFDAVLFHNFLSFLDAEQRNATLAALRPTLGRDGRLVIFQRIAAQGKADAGAIEGEAAAAAVIDRLRAVGIPLPEDEARFAERLAAAASNDKRERRLSAFTSIAWLEGELRDAGYGDIRIMPLTQSAGSTEERTAWRPPSQRYLIVARAGSAQPA